MPKEAVMKTIFLGIIALVLVIGLVVCTKSTANAQDTFSGLRITLRVDTSKLTTKQLIKWPETRDELVKTILPNRIQEILGVEKPKVTLEGENKFIVELPGYTNIQEATKILTKRGCLNFCWLKQVRTYWETKRRYKIIDKDQNIYFIDTLNHNKKIKPSDATKNEFKALLSNPKFVQVILTNADLLPKSRVRAGGVNNSKAVVQIRLNPNGEKRLGDFVDNPLRFREYLAIVLDGEIISAPVNNIMMGRAGASNPIIEGDFTAKEAQQLASLLNSMPLPVALLVDNSEIVKP
jgi:preprotein translocase subunit SecD